jgi:uncharacterized membrane protein YkvA (DUF1232 family)
VSEPHIEIDVRGRERRLYDRVRAKLLRSPRGGGAAGISDLLLLLPDLVVLLARLMRDPAVPLAAKLTAGAGLAYVLSPIDLMPEILLGPLGVLDDVVVAAAAVSRVLNHVHPDLIAAHWSGRGSALESVQRVARWAEERVGERVMNVLGFRKRS